MSPPSNTQPPPLVLWSVLLRSVATALCLLPVLIVGCKDTRRRGMLLIMLDDGTQLVVELMPVPIPTAETQWRRSFLSVALMISHAAFLRKHA